ncbi:MAG: hypothetical protein ABI880_10150 [Acidobacteriota bacterium]
MLRFSSRHPGGGHAWPVDGYVIYGFAGPPVRTGEAVVTIGIPAPD